MARGRTCAVALAVAVVAAGAAVAGGGDPAAEDVEALGRQVDALAVALAAARQEADGLRVRLTEHEFGRAGAVSLKPPSAAVADEPEPNVADGDAKLRMAVLDKGWRQGMEFGARYAVMRNGRGIAVLCVVDVRKDISGAVALELRSGAFPARGDKLVRVFAR